MTNPRKAARLPMAEPQLGSAARPSPFEFEMSVFNAKEKGEETLGSPRASRSQAAPTWSPTAPARSLPLFLLGVENLRLRTEAEKACRAEAPGGGQKHMREALLSAEERIRCCQRTIDYLEQSLRAKEDQLLRVTRSAQKENRQPDFFLEPLSPAMNASSPAARRSSPLERAPAFVPQPARAGDSADWGLATPSHISARGSPQSGLRGAAFLDASLPFEMESLGGEGVTLAARLEAKEREAAVYKTTLSLLHADMVGLRSRCEVQTAENERLKDRLAELGTETVFRVRMSTGNACREEQFVLK